MVERAVVEVVIVRAVVEEEVVVRAVVASQRRLCKHY